MKLKTRKTQYGHEVIECPFCGYFSYIKNERKPTNGIKRHIANVARAEALEKVLNNADKTPHLDYYLEHTSENKVIPTPNKRHFDDDLVI